MQGKKNWLGVLLGAIVLAILKSGQKQNDPTVVATPDIVEAFPETEEGKPGRRLLQRIVAGFCLGLVLAFTIIGVATLTDRLFNPYDGVFTPEPEYIVEQEDQAVAEPHPLVGFIDPKNAEQVLAGVDNYTRRIIEDYPEKGQRSVSAWYPVDEIVWTMETEGAYVTAETIAEAMLNGGGYGLDIPIRVLEPGEDTEPNLIFRYGIVEEECNGVACVNRLGAVYDNEGACVIAMPDVEAIDPQTLLIDDSSDWTRRDAHLTEVIQHEFGHCLGLIHDLGGVMRTHNVWVPDRIQPISEFEQTVAQTILDGLRARVAVEIGSALVIEPDATSGYPR